MKRYILTGIVAALAFGAGTLVEWPGAMALQENPQVISYANEDVRQGCDAVIRTYRQLKADVQDWYAKGLSVPADADLLGDGSATDGRTPITNSDVLLYVSNAEALIAWLEADNNARLNVFLKPNVNGDN